MGVYHIKTWHRQVADLFNRLQLTISKIAIIALPLSHLFVCLLSGERWSTQKDGTYCPFHCVLLILSVLISPRDPKKRDVNSEQNREFFLLCLHSKNPWLWKGRIVFCTQSFIYAPAMEYGCRRRTTQAVELSVVAMVLTQANRTLQQKGLYFMRSSF